MEFKDSSSRKTRSSRASASAGDPQDREKVVKEAVASVIVNERSKYENQIRESQGRLDKYTAENDRLLDEVSNLRIQIREMKNDRAELVRAHHESMSLLAQVSEEKLVEFKSKTEQEALESKAAQEEALRTVLEMMEKDCEERVAELDSELVRVEEERERAAELQLEAAARAAAEEANKRDVEEACRLAVEKLVKERQSRSQEMQHREEREKQLERELEEANERAEKEKQVAAAAAAAAAASDAAAAAAAAANNNGDEIRSRGYMGGYPGDGMDGYSYDSTSYEESTADSSSSSPVDSRRSRSVSPLRPPDMMPPLLPKGRRQDDVDNDNTDGPSWRRPPVPKRRPIHQHQESPFLDDPFDEMTRGRKLALKLQHFSWYQPRGKHWDNTGLGLQSAWAFFEHCVLPRYIVKSTDGLIPTANGELDSNGKKRVSVFEGSDRASSQIDESDDEGIRDEDSDLDDWLDKPKPKKKSRLRSRKSKNGDGDGDGGVQSHGGKSTFSQILSGADLQRASPGDVDLPTRLYSPLLTPLSQMGDFGIGVGLYFSSLRAIAIITLIAGLISMPNIMYFASEDYSGGQPGVKALLKGSAICTEQVWVPCPTCTIDDFDRARNRIAGTTTVTPDGTLQALVFAKKNTCDGATMDVGTFNMASLGFILVTLIVLSVYQRRKQVEFDEQEQTAQDYSIEIWNPPEDATEPEEWKDFFESRFGCHVTCCTVTINNDLLIRALAERREVLLRIEEKVREGSSSGTLSLSELAARIEHGRKFFGNLKSRIAPGIPELVGRLIVLNAKIQGLAQQEYVATRVFCVFETESDQRHILSEMTVGTMTAYKNKTHKINPNLLFRGEHVLLVREAEEPNTIRWLDLDETLFTRTKQVTITTLISFVFVFVVALIVTACRRKSAAAAALAISLSNASFPMIAKILTNFEAHPSETRKQSSLYVKIAIFRWVITAIVITVIMPFTSTLTNGSEHLIQSIYVIFFADLVTMNALQLLDPLGNFQRHVLAPRAASQERMNLLMGGTEYTIAERYTNMTKTLFLTFYYCTIYPGAFFMCAFTLFLNFFVDKFSLMRTWKPAPMLGPYIARFSRQYFMTTAVAAMAIASSYMFASFPYDNLCAQDVSHSAYYGKWKITDGEGDSGNVIVEPGTRSYRYCNQFIGPFGGNFVFPAHPKGQSPGYEWMTDEQENLTGLYGYISTSVIAVIGLLVLYELFAMFKDLYSPSYKADGEDQGMPFSQVENISSYIPQVTSYHFTHPLVAVNVDFISESLFEWRDPECSHSFYDLTRDAEQLLKGNEDLCERAFSQVRHWPPYEPDEEDGGNSRKSALKKSKDTNMRRTVSWSSKVTCKTYSKDDPNNYDFFDGSTSTNEGMNFDGHADPLYDPHAQDEARPYKEKSSKSMEFDPYYADEYDGQDPNFQGDGRDFNNQPSLAEQFDPYYNSGLDYENQHPDQMYGDSQNQSASRTSSDGASWEGSEERSYDRSSSGAGSLENSDNSLMERSDNSLLNRQQHQHQPSNGQRESGFADSIGDSEDGNAYIETDESSDGSKSFPSKKPSFSSDGGGSEQHWEDDRFTSSGSEQNYYEEESSGFGNEDDHRNWDDGYDEVSGRPRGSSTGSFSEEDSVSSDESSAGSSEGLLPRIT